MQIHFCWIIILWHATSLPKQINKSNSTVGAVRVKANLSWTFTVCTIFFSICITRKCLTLKEEIKVMEYNIDKGAIRWRICKSRSVKITTHFVIVLTITKSYPFGHMYVKSLILKTKLKS